MTGPPGCFCLQTIILWQALQDVSVNRDHNFMTGPPGCLCLQIRILQALQDVSVYRSEKPSRMFLCTDQNFTTGPLGCFCLETRILQQALQDVLVYRSEFYNRPSRMFLSRDQNFTTGPPGCFCLQIRKALQDVSVNRSEKPSRMFLSTDQRGPPGCFCVQIRILQQALLNEMKNMPEWKGSWLSARQNVDWLFGDRFYPALVFHSWADSLHSKHWRPLSKSRSRREAELNTKQAINIACT